MPVQSPSISAVQQKVQHQHQQQQQQQQQQRTRKRKRKVSIVSDKDNDDEEEEEEEEDQIDMLNGDQDQGSSSGLPSGGLHRGFACMGCRKRKSRYENSHR